MTHPNTPEEFPRDPFVERARAALHGAATPPPAPDFGRAAPSRRAIPRAVYPIAAAVAAAVVGAFMLSGRERVGAWPVTALEGAPIVEGRRVAEVHGLRPGQWLVTDAGSRATLSVGPRDRAIGTLTLEPGTRVRLVRDDADTRLLELAEGEIRASVLAPPRLFQVRTPGALAVDMGCAYRLVANPDGTGLLEVSSGWVELEREGRVSKVPAGARCRMRASAAGAPPGPGTPVFADAPTELAQAVDALDESWWGGSSGGAEARSALLAEILPVARASDSLTLWHLLPRFEGAEREAVYERLAALVGPPRGVDRGATLSLDGRALEEWWWACRRSW